MPHAQPTIPSGNFPRNSDVVTTCPGSGLLLGARSRGSSVVCREKRAPVRHLTGATPQTGRNAAPLQAPRPIQAAIVVSGFSDPPGTRAPRCVLYITRYTPPFSDVAYRAIKLPAAAQLQFFLSSHLSTMTLQLAPASSPYIFLTTEGISSAEIYGKALPLDLSKLKDGAPVANTAEPGYSAIYRNKMFPGAIKCAISPQLTTFYALLKKAYQDFPDKEALAWREFNYDTGVSAPEYTTMTFRQLDETRRNFGAGLLYLLQSNPYKDLQRFADHAKIDNHQRDYRSYDSQNMSFVATLYSGNRPEWGIADITTTSLSITNTALYDTLGPDTSEYILSSTGLPVVICSADHIELLVDLKAQNPESLAQFIAIVSMDPLDLKGTSSRALRDQGLVAKANANNITLHDMHQVGQVGAIFPCEDLPPRPETLYTISFTSGTTGANPKGVLLTQKIATAGITFVASQFPQTGSARALCFLPLAHIFERQTFGFLMASGSCAGFPRLNGSPLTLVEDMRLYKPTNMSNVPRVYSKFEAALKAATVEHPTSAVKRAIFSRAINAKAEQRKKLVTGGGYSLLYDPTIIRKLRSVLGYDNMLWTVTGSAPISPGTIDFLQASLGASVFQGYGLTESFAGICASISNDSPGSCGAIGITGEIRVRELPDMGYRLDDPKGPAGELMLRGPQVFSAYFKNPEETAKSVSKDGWFSTGDVARISPQGRIYIVDRVKNFFKLAQGEYVTAEKIENAYLSANPVLTQAFVHGDSLRHFLVGVIGMDPQGIKQFLADHCGVSRATIKQKSSEELLKLINEDRNVRKQLLQALNASTNKLSPLQGFERLHNVYVEFEPLTLERGVITPTVKLKRPAAAKFFKTQIDAMYEEGLLLYDQSKL